MMDAEKHSLEHLVEAAVIDILCAHVAGVTWLHFEHEEAQLERPYGLVRLDRGAPDDNCYHTSELSIYIVGACDKNFRCIDEAISCAGDLSNSLNQAEGFHIDSLQGVRVARGTTQSNTYFRNYIADLSVGYTTT